MSRSGKTVLTVANINNYIKSLLLYDGNLTNIYVSGEISNFKRYASGHAYFSLKDATGVLKCVMFQSAFARVSFPVRDGMQVLAFGSINVYERDGVYQLYVQSLEEDGVGSLYEQFEAMKRRLQAEGLFDAAHKRPLPMLPRAVAVVTSPSGAVIQDIRNVTARRFPGMPIYLYPTAVQGAGSAEAIAKAIDAANRDGRADVLIVGRGGGSIEDLWAFNEEVTARAVYASAMPVISAVGHETDFTICDFTADLRAPTPSAAAELAVPEYEACMETLRVYLRRLRKLPHDAIHLCEAKMAALTSRRCFAAFPEVLNGYGNTLMRYQDDLTRALLQKADGAADALERTQAHLRALDPGRVLRRGYAIVRAEDGCVVSTAAGVRRCGAGRLIMQDGDVHFTVREALKEQTERNG